MDIEVMVRYATLTHPTGYWLLPQLPITNSLFPIFKLGFISLSTQELVDLILQLFSKLLGVLVR